MAVVRPWRQRRRKKWMNGIVAFNREATEILVDAMQADLERYALEHDVDNRSLAQKVLAGDAHVLGLNEDRTAVVIAEQQPTVVSEEAMWRRVSHDIDRAQHALRMQFSCDEAPVFGVTPAADVRASRAGCADDPSDRTTSERPMPDDVLPEGAQWVPIPATGQPDIEPIHDDGGVPSPSEVAAVVRAGVCDSPDLVGNIVLYETDGRGGKRYALPAIVTCVQRTHVDLPRLRAAEEQGLGFVQVGNTWHETWNGERRNASNNELIAELQVAAFNDGIRVGTNPLPIPHDGTAHLNVLTPGAAFGYVELSVPFDPQGSPRSFRFHPSSTPF